MEQYRCIHVSKKNPWIPSRIVIDTFDYDNPAVHTCDKFIINNALNILTKENWKVVYRKINEDSGEISIMLTKDF